MKIHSIAIAFVLSFSIISCKEISKSVEKSSKENSANVSKDIKTEEVTYNINGQNYKSFVAYNETLSSKSPVVMVIPEWWGLNDYAKSRAKQLAELGYFAMAVDYYGEGKVVDNPGDAEKLASPFYQIPVNSKTVFDGAKAQLLKFPNADIKKIAVIGYCFGGAQALNMARQEGDLKGAVSFHGNLMTGVKPKNNKLKIMVANGPNDTYVPAKEIAAFKKEMDSAKIDYTFIDYPNSLHSFTNPASTEVGKKFNLKIAYNKEADEKSWNDMKKFLEEVFK